MTPTELAALAELAERAESLQWYALDIDPRVIRYGDDKGDETIIAVVQDGTRSIYHTGNEYFVPTEAQALAYAAYIAAASPSTIKALLSDLAALRAENDELRAALTIAFEDSVEHHGRATQKLPNHWHHDAARLIAKHPPDTAKEPTP